MRIFVTGASGWIGSAATTELIGAGHQVLGLARSDESAAAVAALGADVHRGDLNDIDSLRSGVAACDGAVHLGYNHDFSDMGGAAQTDAKALAVLGATLEDTGGPLIIASGTLGAAPGRTLTESDMPDPALHPRIAASLDALALSEKGVRTTAVRFAPTVHGPGDHGFIATLVGIARAKGASAYVEDGDNCWPAVHRLDAAQLIRLAVEEAPAGTVVHAVAEEGIPTRQIAEAIGRGLGVPVISVSRADAAEHFGWIGMFFGIDASASNEQTRKLLNWEPTHPGLLDDLSKDSYFKTA